MLKQLLNYLNCVMSNKKLICVSGPTAIGKTKLAIRLAKSLKTEIISFDSRQFYKEMSIGTAVPSEIELNEVKHHFIQNKSIQEPFTVYDFSVEATKLINKLFKLYDNIILDLKDLKIPHPKIEIRKFALVPMLELAHDFVHPILNKTIKQLDNDCNDQDIPLKII